MSRIVIICDGTQFSAAQLLCALHSIDGVTVLDQPPPREPSRLISLNGSVKGQSHVAAVMQHLDQLEQYEVAELRADSFRASLTKVCEDIRAMPMQTGKQKAQWKTERKGFKK